MDIRKLIEEIDSIRQIAETWKETDKTPEIEKGIVLDKLKKLYEMLLLPPQPTPTVAQCRSRRRNPSSGTKSFRKR